MRKNDDLVLVGPTPYVSKQFGVLNRKQRRRMGMRGIPAQKVWDRAERRDQGRVEKIDEQQGG
ncbi:MAG: hypothetical protein WC683_04690 [bacterium]